MEKLITVQDIRIFEKLNNEQTDCPMTRLLLCFICLLFCSQIDAQQLPLFTQYRQNATIINPAAISEDYMLYEYNLSFGASYRRQWIGLKSAPSTQTLFGEYIYDGISNVGIVGGMYVMNDQTGPTGFTGAYGRIAGLFSSDPYYNGLSVGLSFGAVQYRVDVTEIRLREFGDVLTDAEQAKVYPDAGLGVYYYQVLQSGFLSGSRIYGGVSIPQLLGLDLTFKDDSGEFYTKRVQHIYALAGMYNEIKDGHYLESSVWFKYAPNAPMNLDFTLRYLMNNKFWVGTGLATSGSFHVEAGVIVGENIGLDNNLKVGYNFDYSITSFGPALGSTHEINVTYALER